MNLLFVCSMNQWRSPTAEMIYRKHPGLQTRSGGTSPQARHRVSSKDLQWADIILVMETKHRQRLLTRFSDAMRFKEMHVLDIPDEFRYMDLELIEELRLAIDPIIKDKV